MVDEFLKHYEIAKKAYEAKDMDIVDQFFKLYTT